jgi:hypothetical protein
MKYIVFSFLILNLVLIGGQAFGNGTGEYTVVTDIPGEQCRLVSGAPKCDCPKPTVTEPVDDTPTGTTTPGATAPGANQG